MSKPIVNLNGTDIEQLLKQHHDVYKLSLKLREALSHASPHGRDYQTGDVAELSAARDEWLVQARAAEACIQWAEDRTVDLQQQNIDRNGSEKAYEILRRCIKEVTP
jgi:hypothetical protein